MDTSYLTSQVASIIAQLHGLFDEIGVPNQERDSREAELFKALSESLNNHLGRVAAEKNEMTEECHRIINTIEKMESSLNDGKDNNEHADERGDLRVSYPLTRCLQDLKQKHHTICKLHEERFEQVKTLVQALESYSSHLEPDFVQILLPPTSSTATAPLDFNLSSTYVTSLDKEFTRVFETYTRRVEQVRSVSEEIVRLWAELGTPQAQTDVRIVKHYQNTPEQLGLHRTDLQRLEGLRQDLNHQRSERERRIKDFKSAIEGLWDRLGVEAPDRKRFLNSNRGCGLRVMNEFEDELARLNELKRQNLHLFVEDSRYRLQELWDSLYFSEEEMLEFTPAFSDVYSDALLSSHEAEIARLEALKEQRAPILQMIEKHRSLVKDRMDLATSSQDASRLMARGQKGERRDPTRLLREEKMRKRIAKELPKVEADLRIVLENWEDEYGRPFCVLGERYMDELPSISQAAVLPPRSKTPSVAPSSTRSSRVIQPAAYQRPGSSLRGPPPSRSGAKTPTGSVRRNPFACSVTSTNAGGASPSKIPARVPLGHMPLGNNSPERGLATVLRDHTAVGRDKMMMVAQPSTMAAPPPKMRSLDEGPRPAARTGPAGHMPSTSNYDLERPRCASAASSQDSVRNVRPDDSYGEGSRVDHSHHHHSSTLSRAPPPLSSSSRTITGAPPTSTMASLIHTDDYYTGASSSSAESYHPPRAESRQISATSSATNTMSGSENWETYDDVSEPERDASEAYYAKLRAAREKRFTPDCSTPTITGGGGGGGPRGPVGRNSPGRKVKGIRPLPPDMHGGNNATKSIIMEGEGGRLIVVSGSEAGWTDEDAF